ELAAGHPDLDAAVVAEAVSHRGGGRAARGRPGRERVAGAALPDEDVDRVARSDPRELDVRAVRKRRMPLDERAQAPALAVVEALDEGHTVRVTDRDGGDRQRRAVTELERHADHIAIGTVHRDLGRPERRVPHLDGDEAHAAALDAALALDDAALGVDRERGLLRPTVIPEILGEDAQAVARLLRLAAVRVEDTQAEVRAAARHQEQDPVRAHSPVPVADPSDRL